MSATSLHNVLSGAPRPPKASVFSAVLTLAWRAMLKIKHVPFQLFDVLVFPIMMTFMFTYLFGGALAGSTRAYLQYLIPGIVVQTLVFLTVYTGVGLNTDITKGLFDRFRSLPIWQPAPIVGALLGRPDALRAGRHGRHYRGADPGVPARRRRDRRRVGGGADPAVRLGRVVAVDHRGHAGEDARVGDDHQHAAAVPADFRQQYLRQSRRRCPAGCRRWFP